MNAHSFDGFPLRPRRGGQLAVLVIARISTVHQDPRSLADQIALCERYVRDRYHGPVAFTDIQGQGSGEYLDRRELAEAESGVEAGRYDLVVVEDLGRICRRNRAIDFCESCEDAGTRLVAINDSIDTARDDWRLSAFFASFKHESANKETAKRIRRSLRNRFSNGGVVQTFPFGYLKPPGATCDADIQKDPAAEPVYDEMFRRLENGATYAEVADWLNSRPTPTGRWTRKKTWTGQMVSRVVHNPVLKGYRLRNRRMSQRINKSGRRKSVLAPTAERLYRVVPHLAFIDPDRFDRLIAKLAGQNGAYARGRAAKAGDSRAGVPKKRTRWPGQHVRCGVCGRLMYWGGHGQQHRMMCAGAREYTCWNAATFDGNDAGRRLADAVLAVAEQLPGFDDDFLGRIRAAADAGRAGRADDLRRLDREAAAAEQEVAHLTDAIAEMGISPALRARLQEAEARQARVAADRADLLARPEEVPELPGIDELKARTRAAVGRLAFDDPAFGRELCQLVPLVVVLPYRPRDGGKIVLRAVATINLVPLLGPAGGEVGDLLTREVSVDLFEPPQRVAYLARVAALRATGRSERAAAKEVGLTVTAAQNAMALHRLMVAAETTDPYELVTAPPDDETKFKRHQHSRYQFRPLDGYPAWPSRRAA